MYVIYVCRVTIFESHLLVIAHISIDLQPTIDGMVCWLAGLFSVFCLLAKYAFAAKKKQQ